MAVETATMRRAYRCLSTDTKPTKAGLDLLYVTDTRTWYIWNGSTWTQYYGA